MAAASRLPLVAVASLCIVVVVAAVGQDVKVVQPYPPFAPSCSTTGNYTDGGQYKKNLDQLLAALPAAAGDNGWFYKGSAGAGDDDQVFGLIMCFADRNATQCQECLASAPAWITKVCPGSRNVSAAYDACVLRYSAAPIPAIADLGYAFSVYVYGEPVTSPGLQGAWLNLMTKLTPGVMASPLVSPTTPPRTRARRACTGWRSARGTSTAPNARTASITTSFSWGTCSPTTPAAPSRGTAAT